MLLFNSAVFVLVADGVHELVFSGLTFAAYYFAYVCYFEIQLSSLFSQIDCLCRDGLALALLSFEIVADSFKQLGFCRVMASGALRSTGIEGIARIHGLAQGAEGLPRLNQYLWLWYIQCLELLAIHLDKPCVAI